MRICDKTIIFKSTPDNWVKEHSGTKPNTIRYLDAYEWDQVKGMKVQNIQIVNTETHQTFTREIEDITIANIKKVPVWVFSWTHGDVQPDGIYRPATAAVQDIINVRMKGIA